MNIPLIFGIVIVAIVIVAIVMVSLILPTYTAISRYLKGEISGIMAFALILVVPFAIGIFLMVWGLL